MEKPNTQVQKIVQKTSKLDYFISQLVLLTIVALFVLLAVNEWKTKVENTLTSTNYCHGSFETGI